MAKKKKSSITSIGHVPISDEEIKRGWVEYLAPTQRIRNNIRDLERTISFRRNKRLSEDEE